MAFVSAIYLDSGIVEFEYLNADATKLKVNTSDFLIGADDLIVEEWVYEIVDHDHRSLGHEEDYFYPGLRRSFVVIPKEDLAMLASLDIAGVTVYTLDAPTEESPDAAYENDVDNY